MKPNDVASPMLMISGHGTIADAVEATRAGAFDFLEKPLGREKVLLSLRHALEESKLREENQRLRELLGGARMIGGKAPHAPALEQGPHAARHGARAVVEGGAGAGQDVLGPHIHDEIPLASRAIVHDDFGDM